MIDVTLRFASAAEAADALARMAGLILPGDRPDAGVQLPLAFVTAAPVAPAVATSTVVIEPTAASVFGGAAAHVPPPPVPSAQTAVPPAPSTAVVAPPPTAPAAPTATLPPPPPVAPPSAPVHGSTAAAPTAPATPTSPAGVEVDAEGLPWDGRIHGSTKSKNADGTWRQKRGLNDPAFKKRVEAELRAALAAGTLPASAGQPVAPPPAPPAAVPPPPVAPPAPPTPAMETFPTLIARLTPHLTPTRLTDAHVARVMQQIGLTGIAQLATRPDLVPAAAVLFDAELAGLPS